MVTSIQLKEPTLRLKISLHGSVQGMGFRPFIYRLAKECDIVGQVRNTPKGVDIDIEGTKENLHFFESRMRREGPQPAMIQGIEKSFPSLIGYQSFEIAHSEIQGNPNTPLLPDMATCQECLAELYDTKNRRYRYPFTTCTNCGPRFSITATLPYDRSNTSMGKFPMCDQCQEEYSNPSDRRFHAQANSCPACGPHLELWDRNGCILASNESALLMAENAIRSGEIVAIKGVGGFQLLTSAGNENAIKVLRRRKNRVEKPFALLYPNLEKIRWICDVSQSEERLLTSREAPIVILQRHHNRNNADHPNFHSFSSDHVAPGIPNLAIMLPCSPLHHLLMQDLDFPVVATSGNVRDEPICIDENEALERLQEIADMFLVHNRPILRPVDDSIVRIIADQGMVLRRARGYAPTPIHFNSQLSELLSVGAHLKNTVAISFGKNVLVSQHIGDLESSKAFSQFQLTILDFQKLYGLEPKAIVCDKHSDYNSSQFAEKMGFPVIRIQHHYAHIRSCMAENELSGKVLGIAWDGTGYGDDGTIWGGEFFNITDSGYRRCSSIRPFLLPGGDYAVGEPRRSALGLLYAYFGNEIWEWKNSIKPLRTFNNTEWKVLKSMLEKSLNTPVTSSVGRLFDALAALLGIRQLSEFEGQAAMELEFAINGSKTDEIYQFTIEEDNNPSRDSPISYLDLKSMLNEFLSDIHHNRAIALISAKFHNTLAEMIIAIAKVVGEERVVLSGGCFQNKYLIERTIARLLKEGFQPFWNKRVPPNDGGISLGQIVAAEKMLQYS